MKEVFIVSAARTPIGSFGGSLSTVSATRLGAVAIKTAVQRAGISPDMVQEVFMGNVLSANLGQSPARQAAIFAGLPNSVPCTTVNKVCSSGIKSVMIAAQSIMAGDNDIVIAGGMENMSLVPHYIDMRNGLKLGHGKMIDGLVHDGLTDVYNNYHMGNAAELCARERGISRAEQDEYAIQSYKRAATAVESGWFKDEIAAVEVESRKGKVVVDTDEEYKNVDFARIPSLKPVFDKDGTVTAANASTLNDGASAIVVMSGDRVKALGLKPLARIVSYSDHEQAPEWFTTAPAQAIPKAVKKAGLQMKDMDYYEINEAFSVVAIANVREMQLDPSRVNVRGGAVALGHPLGASGNRILVSLMHILKSHNARYGVAGLCNGGGGASALVIERL